MMDDVADGGSGTAGVSSDRFRQAMGRFATGVTVVTASASGHDHAMTASSVVSVSLEPKLIAIAVETDARFHDAVTVGVPLGISVLAADQRPTAEWFATRGRPLHGQLDRVPHHRGASGTALIDGALSGIEARVVAVHPAGDHSLVLAEVLDVELDTTPRPALIHHRSRYGALD